MSAKIHLVPCAASDRYSVCGLDVGSLLNGGRRVRTREYFGLLSPKDRCGRCDAVVKRQETEGADRMNAAEIIESVARVLEEIPDDYTERYWPVAARAAVLATLDAIREPTQDQLDAVCSDDPHAAPFTDEIMRGVYRYMIDALKREIAG